MIRLLLFSIAITLPTLLSAQSGPRAVKPDPALEQERRAKTIFTSPLTGNTVSLEISTADLDEKQVFLLQENLLKFEGKVLNCTVNKDAQVLKFTYNEFINLDELIGCFKGASVSYSKD